MRILVFLLFLSPLAAAGQQNACMQFDLKRSSLDYMYSENGKDLYCTCYNMNDIKSYDLAYVAYCMDTVIKDQESFSIAHLKSTTGIELQDLKNVEEVEIDSVKGFEVLVKEKDKKSKKITLYYQLTLFKTLPDGSMRTYVINSIIFGEHKRNLGEVRSVARNMTLE